MNTRLLLPVVAALVLTGCEEWEFGDSNRYKEDFQYSYDAKPGIRLYVETMNGSVDVVGWDKDSIQITGTKHASTEATLKALKVDIVNSPDSVRIRTIGPSGHRGGYGARYMIYLPQKCTVELVESSNGGVRTEAIDGSVRLRTSNGSVKVLRVAGPVEVKTTNASIELTDIENSVIAASSNGGVRAHNVRGTIDATTSNAGMNITLEDPQPQRPIKLATSNGGVELTLGSLKDNDVRISTSNSSITLRLPGNARGMLKAHTSNGNVSTDFDVMVRAGELKKSHLEGQIGAQSGGPMFDLSTSNGGIRVQKM